jgi:hypothetical protein
MMSTARSVVAASVATTLAACVAAFPAQAAGAAVGPASRAALPAAALARAAAAPVRWVCHGPASVFDTPGGVVIGILAQGDHVRVLMHAAGRPEWVMVHGPIEIRGWMRAGALCR